MPRRPSEHEPCPHCGAPVPVGRPACAECGSDAETGWSEDGLSGYTAADIPDTFTDDDYLDAISDLPGAAERETGPAARSNKARTVIGIIAVLAFVGAAVLRSPQALVVLLAAGVLVLIFASPVRRGP